MGFSLLAHQEEAVAKLRNGSVLVGGVGSGKSITGLSYLDKIKPGAPIYVITTAKKRDSGEWYSDAMKMSLKSDMVVDSWNNIAKHEDVKDACFIFDEQRIVGYGKWVKTFLKIAQNNKWILLTATPADVWMDLLPVFIANGFYKNKTEFTERHVKYSRYTKYPSIVGYYDEWLLERHRRSIYVEMAYLSPATRIDHMVDVTFDREAELRLYRDRWNIFEDAPLKDAGELMRCMRISANSDPSRIEAIKDIWREHPRLIIFYNHNYELDILRTLHTELDVPLTEWNGHRHESIPEGDKWIYLVQYQAGGEGWNCTTTDSMVFYSLPYSYRQLEQAKGRIDRMNTTYEELHYYTLKSRAIIDQAIWRGLSRKKNFQASAFAKKHWRPTT